MVKGSTWVDRLHVTLASFNFTYLIKLDNVGMADLLQNFNLSCDTFDIFLVLYFFLFEDLDSDLK